MGALAAGIGTLAGTAARAGDSTIDFKYLFYGESDGRTQVSNPELYFQHQFGEKGQLSFLFSYDAISGASPTGAGPTLDATTSASGTSAIGEIPMASYQDTRKAISASYMRRLGSHLPSLTLSYSRESDYLSRGASLVDSWELFGGRSTLHYGVGGTSDEVEPVNTDEQLPKSSLAFSAGWTQILGPRDLLDVSIGIDNLSGYLTDPYKVVSIGTETVPEVRPDSRSRNTVVFKYGHYFLSRGALKTAYRYYWDDWGVKAQTLDLIYDQRIGRRMILTPQLRYYRQGSAEFFAYQYQSPQLYMTSDYRLSAFWSWLAGIGLTVELSDSVSLNVVANYMNQTGIDRIEPSAVTPAAVSGGISGQAVRARRGALLLGGRRTRVLGEDGGGDDGGGEGGSSPQSISPADMRVLTVTAGFSVRF